MSVAVTLNGFRVISVRIVQVWRGAWFADVDVDPDNVSQVGSSGPAVLVVGTAPGPMATLVGVLDPLASGAFVATSRVRMVGGKGGWSQSVTAQHMHSDAQLTSTAVYNQVASQVGETVTDLVPSSFGPDYMLSAGPASRVFDGVSWWVDPATGVTSVGARPPATADPSLEILDWDPLQKLATVACDTLVAPGTVLSDTRIADSPVTVRDVEQRFDASGSRALCWCSPAGTSPLQAALRTIVREFGRTDYLKTYSYRVVGPGTDPGTWILQAVNRGPQGQSAPMPDAVPLLQWSGMAGVSAKLPPSLEVLVEFVEGDPKQPRLVGYSLAKLPTEVTVDASAAAHLAPTAPSVDVGSDALLVAIAGGASPLVVGAWAAGLATALTAFTTALGSATDPAVTGAATALATALGALPSPVTTRTKAT